MKRNIVLPVTMLFVGLLVGGAVAYFFVARAYSQAFQQFVSGPVYERVIVAAQLRAGLQDKTLSQSDEIIAQGVVALRNFPDQNKRSLHTLRMAKAYFEYSGASAAERTRVTLAEVEPLPKKQFEALRGSPNSRGQ